MIYDKEYIQELCNRSEKLYVETCKMKRALQAVLDGEVFEESFDDEIFMERDDIKDGRSQATVLMEHLLKFRFSTTDTCHRTWVKNSIVNPRKQLLKDIAWSSSDSSYDKITFRKIEERFEKSYRDAVANYKDASKKWTDLKEGVKRIPKECPWKLMDLITKEFSDLLDMIIDTPESERERLKVLCEEIDRLAAEEMH